MSLVYKNSIQLFDYYDYDSMVKRINSIMETDPVLKSLSSFSFEDVQSAFDEGYIQGYEEAKRSLCLDA